MFHLVYTSVAQDPFTGAEMLELLERARKKNLGLDITGLLLYQNGSFMQMLEGEEAAVRNLYAAIRKDARHHHVFTLVAKSVDSRQFSDWSMGYKELEGERFRPVIDSRPQMSNRFEEEAADALHLLGNLRVNA